MTDRIQVPLLGVPVRPLCHVPYGLVPAAERRRHTRKSAVCGVVGLRGCSSGSLGDNLGAGASSAARAIATGAKAVAKRATSVVSKADGAANTARADFIASADGVVVPTSRSRLVAGFEEAGLPSTPTTSAGTQYTLPNGSLVRVMEPSGQAGLRASFTNANGGPINPFTGKPVQPPPGLSKPERLDYIRSRTHIQLGP
ncbi:hypothetical protein ACT17Q_11005 [Cellulomonas sp. CW35]|uniref:hypothetical protein n=1 Tax=Cellulomonas sp. CW35 TaxID=3458249 RepID=UPI00403458CE